jgi:hypothetical protein
MASAQARNALRLHGGTLSRTLAQTIDEGNRNVILLGVILSCVINGDTVSGILRQGTWLVVAVIILVVVQAVHGWLGARSDGSSLARSRRNCDPLGTDGM